MHILLWTFPQYKALILLASIIITTAIVMIQGFIAQSDVMEQHFIDNFRNTNDAFNEYSKKQLTNNNIHIEEITVSPDTSIGGKTLEELDLFSRTGTNIVSIERGSDRINIPGKDNLIFPYDKLIVATTDEGLNELTEALSQISSKQTDSFKQQINISLYEITPDSPFIGKQLSELDLRDKYQCMIIGMDRNDSSMPVFSGDTLLMEGDVLWLAGEQDKLDRFEF